MRRGGGLEFCSARAAKCPGDPGMEGSLAGPPVPRVPAPDPPSRTLGAAPARLSSLRALLPPGPPPIALQKVRGARALKPGPSCRERGEGLGVSSFPKGVRGGHPLVPRDRAGAAVAGHISLLNC